MSQENQNLSSKPIQCVVLTIHDGTSSNHDSSGKLIEKPCKSSAWIGVVVVVVEVQGCFPAASSVSGLKARCSEMLTAALVAV